MKTKHVIVDLETHCAYGVMLDKEGNCLTVQPLETTIKSESSDKVVFSSLSTRDTLPYGQVTTAIEVKQDGTKGEVFTLVWPKKEDADKGVMPIVAKKEMPSDLVKSGLAPTPKTAKGQKGSGLDSDEELKQALKNIDSMIGLDQAKLEIKQNIAVAQFNRLKVELGLSTKSISRHMVFSGNPGTGKTTFAREVAKVYHALGIIEKPVVHEVKREDLVAGYIGQTAIKTKEAIDKAKGGILFIDEAYALSREAGGGDGKDFGREAIDTLVAAMENMREDLIVIVAGYPEPMKRFIDANEGLKSRFMTYIAFEDYSVMQLGQILDSMLAERGCVMETAARERAMTILETEKSRSKKDFGNGRTVRNLVEKAEKEIALRLFDTNKLSKSSGLTPDELRKELVTITLKDIERVTLDGLSVKKVEKRGIGIHQDAFKTVAANDPGRAVAPPIKAKAPIKKDFKP